LVVLNKHFKPPPKAIPGNAKGKQKQGKQGGKGETAIGNSRGVLNTKRGVNAGRPHGFWLSAQNNRGGSRGDGFRSGSTKASPGCRKKTSWEKPLSRWMAKGGPAQKVFAFFTFPKGGHYSDAIGGGCLPPISNFLQASRFFGPPESLRRADLWPDRGGLDGCC